MPQLSPLNWMLLYIVFWLLIICIASMVWWASTPKYKTSYDSSQFSSKWSWC
uniref:ATP synthase F0 subunit 8 n=1 Tax=Eualetes tulipa TaxID=765164 RepID=E2FLT2_9CAEN|nr:ATP synthase F0 subunit 8 [Eualetes tulipa]ADI79398.1 ATP synthase F0 subunit 8 [Eualetes tulipa]